MQSMNTLCGGKVKKERATLFKSTYNRATLPCTCFLNDSETDDDDKT